MSVNLATDFFMAGALLSSVMLLAEELPLMFLAQECWQVILNYLSGKKRKRKKKGRKEEKKREGRRKRKIFM